MEINYNPKDISKKPDYSIHKTNNITVYKHFSESETKELIEKMFPQSINYSGPQKIRKI